MNAHHPHTAHRGPWSAATALPALGACARGETPETAPQATTGDGATGPSTEETATLLYMIEEEKFARDVYDALQDVTGLTIFDRIGSAEQSHYDALLRQADRLDIDAGDLPSEAGVFADAELQQLYDALILQGSVSTTAALEVGVFIEETDIVDIAEAIEQTDDAALDATYAHLLAGSESHLAAFESVLLA